MGSILVRSPRLTQPKSYGTKVAAPGCVVAYVPTVGPAINAQNFHSCGGDLVSGVPVAQAVFGALNLRPAANANARACWNPTGASGANLSGTIQLGKSATLEAGEDFSILAVVLQTAYPTSGNAGIWREGANSAGTTFFYFSGTTGRPLVRVNGTNVLSPGSGEAIANGTQNIAVAARVRSGAYADCWWGGRRRHFATHAVATAACTVSEIGVNFTDYETIGPLAALLFFRRYLTDQEMAQYTAHPWEVFAKARRLLPLDATVSGAAFHARPYYDMATHHGISGAGV